MKYWSKEFVKYVINDAVRLDAINWSNITRGNVCVFRDKRYSQLAPEYILLTEKDRIRLKKFYPKLPENFEIININGLLPSAFYATPRSIMVTDYRREK